MSVWSTRVAWLAFLASILLVGLPSVTAQSRVFSTCQAIADGIESSVARNASSAIRDFCRRAESRFSAVFGDETESDSVVVDGRETPVEDIEEEDDVAISTSSVTGVPFTVVGGEDEEAAGRTRRGLATRFSASRPNGPWFSITAVDVRTRAGSVWSTIRDIGDFFSIALRGLARTQQQGEERVRVTLDSGGRVVFDLEDTDNDERFHVFRFERVTENIYPGFNFEGSRLYVQVLSQGFFSRTTNIEMGWGPPASFDIGGDTSTGVRLIESLLLEMLENLEGRFGQRCEFGRNIRTVEGDCNNLDDPPRGSANQALRRLGDGLDPAYPRGDRSIPSGALDINVRTISNALFTQSPGKEILDEQASDLRGECVSTTINGGRYDVCPFRFVRIRTRGGGRGGRGGRGRGGSSGGRGLDIIPFDDVIFNNMEELTFRFRREGCTIDVLLKCGGERSVDLAEDPCGAKTNRLFDPVGCVISPGEDDVLTNPEGLTDFFFTFGQFIDHDYGLSPLSQIDPDQPGFTRLSRRREVEESFPIIIPENDFHFEREEMEFTRARFSEEDPDSQVNLHSSYLDASHIYGVDFTRARLLRSFEGGKLDLSTGNLPPFNRINGPGALGAVVENGPNREGRFFVVGDPRGNEQLLLLALHVVFLREHNLVADEVAEAFPDFDDELIYQTARAIVIAEYQCIVYNEWLPLLLGLTSPKSGDFEYDEDVDATVSAIFTTAAFRFGHSMVGTNLLQMGPGRRRSASMKLIPIREAFFQPEVISEEGIDPFVRGGAWHLCKELDNKIVDELRNFLVTDFPENVTEPDLFDLMALNLQRGRDMGLPAFNDIRELFGLRRYNTFSEFIRDPNLADLASEVYEGDVDKVDPFFGGMVEPHIANSQLGETFNTIIADQFTRSRDGDRFFYTGIKFDDVLIRRIPRVQDIIDDKIKLGDIILRTTKIKSSELGRRESVFQI